MPFKGVCNICLTFDAPMRVINKSALQNIYEKLTNKPLNTADQPVIACYWCYSQLRNSHNLMVKSMKADRVLTQIQQSGEMAKEELITILNLESRQLSNALVVTSVEVLSIADTNYSAVKVEGDPLSLEYKESTERDSLITIENIKSEKLGVEDIERDLLDDGGMDNDEFTDGGYIKKEEIDIASLEIEDVTVGETCETEDGTVLALREIKKSVKQKSRNRETSRRKERNASIVMLEGIHKVNNRQGSESKPIYSDTAINKIHVSVDCNNDCTNTDTDVDNTGSKDLGGLINIADDDIVDDLFLLTEHDEAGKVKRDLTRVDENLQEKILLKKSSNKRGKYKCKNRIKWSHFECDICQKKVTAKRSLIHHLRTHTGEKPFICEICAMRFVSEHQLNVHLGKHSVEKRFECNTCHAKFKSRAYFNIHLKMHTGRKTFKCVVCQKIYVSKVGFTYHLRTHTGVKPFECTICQRGFGKKNALNVHLRTHNFQEVYECNICQKWFSTKPSLNVHIRTHTGVKPFECKQCQRKFNTAGHLKRHITSHTGDKPYECDVCHVKFARKCNLITHFRTHTGEKPFQCVVCKRKFSQGSSLKTHFKTHNR